MTVMIQDQAICIRAVDYSETSQVVTFYGRAHGKFAAIVKGAKRPKSSFGGAIERFAYDPVLASEGKSAQLATLIFYLQRWYDGFVRRMIGVVETSPEEQLEERHEEFLSELEQRRMDGAVDELDLPEDEDYDTVGGFVFTQLGYIPKTGETFTYKNLTITVLSAEARRINRLRIVRTRAVGGEP